MKLPRDTKVSFLIKPSDEHPESYTARFDRAGYYRLDLSIYQHGAPRQGEIPQNYVMNQGFTVAQATTYSFVVRLDWVVQRNNNFLVADDYQRWAEALYKNFEARLEN